MEEKVKDDELPALAREEIVRVFCALTIAKQIEPPMHDAHLLALVNGHLNHLKLVIAEQNR
jgi:hypothetical protein